jgi:hypothetical protein
MTYTLMDVFGTAIKVVAVTLTIAMVVSWIVIALG